MTVLIANTTIVTGVAERTVMYDAALAVDAGRIVELGPTEQVLANHTDAEVVDGVWFGRFHCVEHVAVDADVSAEEFDLIGKLIQSLQVGAAAEDKDLFFAALQQQSDDFCADKSCAAG